MDMINVLYVSGAIALIALAVLFVYLVLLLKRVNSMMDKQVTPMLDDAKDMTESLKPAAAQVDPLMERLNLTMDAANLELMRVDEILEDVSVITDKLAGTTSTVNDIANVPLSAVNGVTGKVRGFFKRSNASSASADLGAQKEAGSAE